MADKALIVGINAYPRPYQLSGCVRDAEHMIQYLVGKRKFTATVLLDKDATREHIMNEAVDLVHKSKYGDRLATTLSGHGTYLQDKSRDEVTGWDQAFCPVDYASAGFIIDDDLRYLLYQLPEGVSFTGIVDCCHSGTIMRALGVPTSEDLPVAKGRSIPWSRELQEVHENTRPTPRSGPQAERSGEWTWDTIAACQPHEVAWERNGMGDFTRRAYDVLMNSGHTLTLGGFMKRLGTLPDQTPHLDTPDSKRILLGYRRG